MATDEKSSKFQIGIAVGGLLVTAILGSGQFSLSKKQNQIIQLQKQAEDSRAKDAIEVQVMTMVGPYLSKMRGPSEEAANARKVVDAAASFLKEAHSKPALGVMYQRILREDPSVKPEAQVQAEKFAGPSLEGAGWFTVLASLPGDDEKATKKAANEIRSRALGLGFSEPVQVYKTKISDSYAVVIGGKLSKADAFALMARVRERKLAIDAFAQEDRNWDLEDPPPFSRRWPRGNEGTSHAGLQCRPNGYSLCCVGASWDRSDSVCGFCASWHKACRLNSKPTSRSRFRGVSRTANFFPSSSSSAAPSTSATRQTFPIASSSCMAASQAAL